jgi:uncharacterized protein
MTFAHFKHKKAKKSIMLTSTVAVGLSLLLLSPEHSSSTPLKNNVAPPATRSASATPTALQRAIASYIKQQGAALEESHRFFADYIDLNGDGTQDAVVVFSSPHWCGTGGCTMLVFKGQEDGTFRLVSESALVRPPLTASENKTNGWRDLIVGVSGGGIAPKKVALEFDGKGYPLNPSVQPGLPPTVPIAGTVLFPEGSKPQTLTGMAAHKPPSRKARPSFDCTKAQGRVEKSICKDGELAALDRKLDGIYQIALKQARRFPPQDLANFKAEQTGWLKSRNDCSQAKDNALQACVKDSYRDRIAELQAAFALVPGKKPIFFTCNKNPANEVAATFYETDPPAVRLERGDTAITAIQRPSGSGARYEAKNVTFWIKGKEASMNWKGDRLLCQAR